MAGMPIVAQLLGPPLVVRDAVVFAAPRGRKAWALLAYLALAEQPPSRQVLADLLFPDAEDPASALRWNLSELRRLLGGPETVGSGNTVGLRLPSGSTIDARVLVEGTAAAAVELPGLGRELLEGVEVDASPGFTAWLLGERRRLASLSGAVLREGALRALAAGNPARAVDLATRLIGVDPLSEDAHVLLVRAFAATGDEVAVQRQLDTSVDLFRLELGEDLRPELLAAARIEQEAGTVTPGLHVSVSALLESGEAAVAAGAVEAGIRELRAAASTAAAGSDRAEEATAWLALGTALVHAAKGQDEEGAAALHRAIAAADTAGDRRVSASAHRELGYIELLRAQYARTTVWLRRAAELADDDLERSKVRSIAGAAFSDVGKHAQGATELRAALALAGDDLRQRAWSLTCLGRTLTLVGELEEAESILVAGIEATRQARWTSFLPFPESMLGEVLVYRGRLDEAAGVLEHAFTLGCSVNDACWEAYSGRGLGMLAAARGDLGEAVALLDDALRRCARQRDTHRWIRAFVSDALCAVGIRGGDARAGAWAADLAAFAGAGGMAEFSVRAYLYRAELGDPEALEAARTLMVGVESPRMDAAVRAGASPLVADLVALGS
jgi:DNA-binding SARP family transcriptional activator